MTEHTSACRHGQTGECAACSDERYDELARLRAERNALLGGDPLATAYRMGRAQAQDEARLDQKFCPHCNPCRRAEEITKAEAERDAARAELADARKDIECDEQRVAELMAQVDEVGRERDAARALHDKLLPGYCTSVAFSDHTGHTINIYYATREDMDRAHEALCDAADAALREGK